MTRRKLIWMPAIQSTEGLGFIPISASCPITKIILNRDYGFSSPTNRFPWKPGPMVLYGQASKALEGLFTGDISPKSLEKATNETTHLSMYLSLNPKVLRSMMSMTSNDITPSPIPSMSASTAWDCISMSFLGKARPRWVRFLSDCCFTTSESPG